MLAAALEKTMHDPILTLDADAACCCRGCGLELGVAVVLTWLTRCSQVQPLGLVVRDKQVKIILAGGRWL